MLMVALRSPALQWPFSGATAAQREAMVLTPLFGVLLGA